VAISDVLSVCVDLAAHVRESRILQHCNPDTGCVSSEAFRDATDVLADACKLENRSAAFLVVHTARNYAIPDGGDAAGQSLRAFLDDEADAGCVIAKLGVWRYTILAPDQSPRDAVALAARLRWRLRTFSATPVASSVGIAMMPRNGATYEALLAAASTVLDEALGSGGDNERIAPLRQRPAPAATVRIDGGRSIAMLNALASMVDQMYFAGTNHSAVVASRTREIGCLLGVSGDLLEHLTLAGALHDVGRAILAPELFMSITPTKAERSLIQTHVVLGARLVSNAGFGEAGDCIANMHERWEGGGEPHGKSGIGIPLGGRILAVANAFETVLGGHGRGDSGFRAAVTAVAEQRGGAFDPDIVDCLIGSLRTDQSERAAG
jgi:HD-GYP domain-containing protein (c-di-GMP phosphodiesterase class II)